MRTAPDGDVPLGMFLSGGIDSSAIAALMAREIDRPVETFSVAFADRAFSELDYARAGRARHRRRTPRSRHRRRGLLQRAAPADLARGRADRPPSSVPLHFVSMLAREHVKVVLTGEGSDELLAGYGKYPRALFNWRAGARLRTARARGRSATVAPTRRAATARRRRPLCPPLVPRHAAEPSAMFLDNFAGMPLRQQRELLSRGARRRQIRMRRRLRISEVNGAQRRCSGGCCTPTSRRIWSSCS